jgi:hypothetical protein
MAHERTIKARSCGPSTFVKPAPHDAEEVACQDRFLRVEKIRGLLRDLRTAGDCTLSGPLWGPNHMWQSHLCTRSGAWPHAEPAACVRHGYDG